MPGEAVASEPAVPILGYYGKVPTHGDFIRRRLPRSFLDPWDRWLQRAMASSRERLAEAWLDRYLTAPIWRFALSPEVCGDRLAAGVLMPSVDSVGRYYPMSIAVVQPLPGNLFALAARGQDWFARAEETALYCLENGFLPAAFEERLDALGAPPGGLCAPAAPAASPALDSARGLGWRIEVNALSHLSTEVYPGLLDEVLGARFAPYSLWWTAGSSEISPRLLVYGGLPPADDFSWFLAGDGADDDSE
ncbi:MAG: type VI secretion system-associated protein TagF [Kiloniellaceae bacterium]